MEKEDFLPGFWETKEVRICSCGMMLSDEDVIRFHEECTSQEHIQSALQNGELITLTVWKFS